MRKLTKPEFDLIATLLKDQPNCDKLIGDLPNIMVKEMDDGGMGSLRFLSGTDKQSRFGEQIAEIVILDVDNCPVSFALNLDEDGEPFELDVFKADFSPLKQFPIKPYNCK
jgi:hypothetical protein